MLDPVLTLEIVPPWPYYRKKLARTWPLFLWFGVGISTLGIFHGKGSPPGDFLCALFGSVPIALIPAISPLLKNIREIRAARRARPHNRRAIAAILEGDGATAEELLRRVLSDADLGSPALAGLVHNLGLALLAQGAYDPGHALLKHAKDSGWMDTWQYRRALRAPPNPPTGAETR